MRSLPTGVRPHLVGILCMAAIAGAAGPAAAAAIVASSAVLPDGPAVAAPYGFTVMCRQTPALCERATPMMRSAAWNGPAPAVASPAAAMRALVEVNRTVNGSVLQRTDEAVLGEPDHWNRPLMTGAGPTGDCEDIAIEKRERLLDRGWRAQDLMLAVVYRRDIGLHVVLVARVDGADYVLDSRSPWVEPWTRAPYQWVKRQSSEDPMAWRMVPPAASVVASISRPAPGGTAVG